MDTEQQAATALIRTAEHLRAIRSLLGWMLGVAVVIALLLTYVVLEGVRLSELTG